MSYNLQATSTDEYQYLTCPASTRITLQVANAAILIGFGNNPKGINGGGQYPNEDEAYLPISGGLARACDEIRIKSYATGTPAIVFITAQ